MAESDRFWKALSEGVIIQALAESALSADEREVIDLLDSRFVSEQVKRGGEFSSPEEESQILEDLLDLIPGARAAFERREVLEEQLETKSGNPTKHIN